MAHPPAGTSRRPCSPWSRTSSPLGAIRRVGAIRRGYRPMGAHHRTSSPPPRDPERGEGPTPGARVRGMAHGPPLGLGHRPRTRLDRKSAEHRPGQRRPPPSRQSSRSTHYRRRPHHTEDGVPTSAWLHVEAVLSRSGATACSGLRLRQHRGRGRTRCRQADVFDPEIKNVLGSSAWRDHGPSTRQRCSMP